MEFKEPKIFMLAKTEVDRPGMSAFLDHAGSPDWDTDYGDDAEWLIEVAGRSCYRSFEPGLNANVTKVREGNKSYLNNILKQGHGSVLEHATVTFAFADVTRVFTHEIVRHRAGTAFSQESLRYVRLDSLSAFYPEESLAGADWARSTMRDEYKRLEDLQVELADIFRLDDEPSFDRKKKLTSVMRRFAPIGLCTNIVVTANHRTWRHIIGMRCNEHAEEEIRKVMTMVAKRLKFEFPALYQDMTLGIAEDGGPVVKLAHGRV